MANKRMLRAISFYILLFFLFIGFLLTLLVEMTLEEIGMPKAWEADESS